MANFSPILLAQVEAPSAPAQPVAPVAPTTGTQQPAKPPAPPPQGGLFMFLPLIIFMFVLMYFMQIRPERRRQKEHQKLLDSLKPGDKVIAAGGIHGIVANVKDKNTVLLKVADNLKIEVSRSTVQAVLNKPDAPAEVTGEKAQKS